MAEKLEDDFRSGTRLVWLIDPATKSAEVYTGIDAKTILAGDGLPGDGLLSGEPVLTGFSVSLVEIFDVDLT